MAFTEGGRFLLLQISRGISPELHQNIEKGALDPICADTLEIREPLQIIESPDISKMSFLREEGIIFLVVVPLLSGQGLLFLASRVGRDFDFDFTSLLTLVGNMCRI